MVLGGPIEGNKDPKWEHLIDHILNEKIEYEDELERNRKKKDK